MTSKYLDFVHVADKPKTKVWEVLSKNHGDVLGTIKWYAQWRQYCFFPEKECLFNSNCLIQIELFMGIANDRHKHRKGKESAEIEE